jgi:hypothetical protein
MPLDHARLMKAVGTLLAESDAAAMKAIDEVREEVAAQIAALPPPLAGPPGSDGRDGRDGADGADRVVLAPAAIGPDQRCPRNEIIHHGRGIWQAIRATSGDPDHDPAGWTCIVPGIAGIAFAEDLSTRRATFTVRTSDGEAHEFGWRLPAGFLPHDWQERGWGIIAGDVLRDGDHDYRALVDFPGNPLDPRTAENWEKIQVIGRRGRAGDPGRKGDPGERGEPGPGLTGLSLVRDPVNAGLAILPRYADSRINPEPIAVDLMTEPAEQGRAAIVGFVGPFHAAKQYARGDVVSAVVQGDKSLWVSLIPDNRKPLTDGGSWQRMI